MYFPENIVLEDDRVLLRPLQNSDLPYLIPFAEQEPDLWQFALVAVAGPAGMLAYVEAALADRAKGTTYPFIVFDKSTGAYAGSTRFYDLQPAHQTVQLGYTWYGSRFQGSGLNRHCKYLLLQYAFEEMGAARVEFRADVTNHRSVAAMKAIGCVPEGILRRHLQLPDGRRRDSIILSILRQEWYDGVKKRLQQMIRLS